MRCRQLALVSAALLLGALTAGAYAAPPETKTDPPRSGYKDDVRRRVRAGELHDCVTDFVSQSHAQPRLVFHNHCDAQVNVSLCVRVAGQDRAYFLLLMGRKSEAQQMLWIEPGARYSYKYNACEKPYCTPPEPDC
jgi:hypothetical protein